MIKNMNSKMTTNLQLSTTEPKKTKNKLSKQLEEEPNYRNGDHIVGHQQGGEWGGGKLGEKAQEIRSIIGRYRIDRGRLRIV